jgi:hypothetical protein
MSKKNVLIRSELREDKIMKPSHENNHRCDLQRARAVNDRHIIGSHVENVVSFLFEYYSESVGVLVSVL